MLETDPYLAAVRRKSRLKALLAAVAVLGVMLGLFWTEGQEKARIDRLLSHGEAAIGSADFDDLKAAMREANVELSQDDRADATILALDARAELLIHVLYTGVYSQRQRAEEMLEIAQERNPEHPAVKITEALVEACVGNAQHALSMLEGGFFPPVLSDQADVARAEALMRTGDLEGALQAIERAGSPLGRTWAARVAWQAGDMAKVKAAAQAAPDSTAARILGKLADARLASPQEAEAQLRALASGGEPLSALHAAEVAVELSRVLRRGDKVDQADELLVTAHEEDENSVVLRTELARVKRFQGSFGAARTLADKGLRTRNDDPELLAELAQAAFFNDGATTIEDRARRVPNGSEDSAGVRRANALAALVRGNSAQAIAGLEATRHLSTPGETDLWLAEAWLSADNPNKALAAARRARELLSTSMGASSREVAVAQMYEGLALAASGSPDEAGPLLDAAWTKQNQTPWTAWVYGRYHLAVDDRANARTALLLACHKGQDFARSCLDAADVYEESSGGRSLATLKELRKHYLRTAPKGWNSDAIRTALDRD